MKFNHKIRAFTIMELVIAMLISAVVIGMMYSAYMIVGRSYQSFIDRNGSTATLSLLDQRLNRDISKADNVTRDSNTITLRGSRDTVIYRFQANQIIRQKTLADTFKINTKYFSTSFESITVEGGHSQDQEKRIDDLQLVLEMEGQQIPYHYHKLYSSVNLFQPLDDANY